MSDENSPNQVPQTGPAEVAPAGSSPAASDGPGISHLLLEHCKATRRWVRYLAIMLIVLCAIMPFLAATQARRSLPVGGQVTAIIVSMMSIGLYIPAIVHLFRYAASLQKFLAERTIVQLENALGSQKSFWKYAGILSIVGLSLVALTLLLIVPMSKRF
ncbi:MAG: hypothetical protein A2177_13860 [Spirochaetes bacterium RBG_13_68_11]|nr:MAG: hypothetical protein A2177_13860 [Spirochaetes bacterium RBG_13_68_11]